MKCIFNILTAIFIVPSLFLCGCKDRNDKCADTAYAMDDWLVTEARCHPDAVGYLENGIYFCVCKRDEKNLSQFPAEKQ